MLRGALARFLSEVHRFLPCWLLARSHGQFVERESGVTSAGTPPVGPIFCSTLRGQRRPGYFFSIPLVGVLPGFVAQQKTEYSSVQFVTASHLLATIHLFLHGLRQRPTREAQLESFRRRDCVFARLIADGVPSHNSALRYFKHSPTTCPDTRAVVVVPGKSVSPLL